VSSFEEIRPCRNYLQERIYLLVSGIIGHITYATLAGKAAEARRLPVAPVIRRNFSSYLAGCYLGCDIQTMPSAVCIDTGEEIGHGPSPVEKSPITGGKVRPWKFKTNDGEIEPREIHQNFYGRSHLIMGWKKEDQEIAVPLSKLLDYAADVTGDAMELFGPGESSLAYVLGWITHLMGDGLIKSVIDGLNLNLLGSTYSAKNRPVQDLISFNEIGIKELGLNWPALLDDLTKTPVLEIQAHYMRCSKKQGRLGAHFSDGWLPDKKPLLRAIMAENRRYQRIRNPRLTDELTLKKSPGGKMICNLKLSEKADGLTYTEMLEAAGKANFRHALWQMGEIIADAFEKIIERQELLQDLPIDDGPDWKELTRRLGPTEN